MLRKGLLVYDVHGATVAPRYLHAADRPWLGILLELWRRYAGQPCAALADHLRDPLPGAPPGKLHMARFVLDRLARQAQPKPPFKPRLVRSVVFTLAARAADGREAVIAEAGERIGATPDQVEGCLFADAQSERRVGRLPGGLGTAELALRVNLAAAQCFLALASRIEIRALGNARALVRQASLLGLICSARGRAGEDEVVLHVSGPLALFRRTRMYGRALGSLVPCLAWCERFELRAACELDGERRTLVLRTGDPILPGKEPPRYDSKLEERFARDFGRLATSWNLVREPEPVEADGSLIFPDFALVHRYEPARKWLLEIAGFWTPGYLENKLSRLRAAGLTNLILCVDAQRDCSDGDLPPGAAVIRYRRRVSAKAVLAFIEGRSEEPV